MTDSSTRIADITLPHRKLTISTTEHHGQHFIDLSDRFSRGLGITITDDERRQVIEALGGHMDTPQGEPVAYYLVESDREESTAWRGDQAVEAYADASKARGTVTALHRGAVVADYRKPQQCEWTPDAWPEEATRCWRNEHDGRHVWEISDGDLETSWGVASGESHVDAIIAAVRDRDRREAGE